MDDLHEAIADAWDTLETSTGATCDELFGDRIIDQPGRLPPEAERAVGTIEGAALALGMTPLELLDQLGLG